MTALDARSARRRYLILLALRWLPTGLLIPIFVLLPLSRGLSLTEIGIVFAVQGFVVFALELPTGGLSDSLGRRPVLILASFVGLLSLALVFLADSVAMFAAAMFLQGIYRALDSGPLEAWYVDATLAAEPDAQIESGLGAGTHRAQSRDRVRGAAGGRPHRPRSVPDRRDPRAAGPRGHRPPRGRPRRHRGAHAGGPQPPATPARWPARSRPCRVSSATVFASSVRRASWRR